MRRMMRPSIPIRMIPLMNLVMGSILGLGESTSSFGTTLALLLTFVVVMGGVVNFLVGYVLSVVMVERKQNQQRMREYDSQHNS
jgi:membrane protein YqaA with SNARE-associated domain